MHWLIKWKLYELIVSFAINSDSWQIQVYYYRCAMFKEYCKNDTWYIYNFKFKRILSNIIFPFICYKILGPSKTAYPRQWCHFCWDTLVMLLTKNPCISKYHTELYPPCEQWSIIIIFLLSLLKIDKPSRSFEWLNIVNMNIIILTLTCSCGPIQFESCHAGTVRCQFVATVSRPTPTVSWGAFL